MAKQQTVITAHEKEKIEIAYKEIRTKHSDTKWMILHYTDEGTIKLKSTGNDLKKFCEHFKEDVVIYAYLKVECDHNGKKITEYVYCEWIGRKVTIEKKERVNGHEVTTYVKEVIKERTCELIYVEQKGGLTEIQIRESVEREGTVHKSIK